MIRCEMWGGIATGFDSIFENHNIEGKCNLSNELTLEDNMGTISVPYWVSNTG